MILHIPTHGSIKEHNKGFPKKFKLLPESEKHITELDMISNDYMRITSTTKVSDF